MNIHRSTALNNTSSDVSRETYEVEGKYLNIHRSIARNDTRDNVSRETYSHEKASVLEYKPNARYK